MAEIYKSIKHQFEKDIFLTKNHPFTPAQTRVLVELLSGKPVGYKALAKRLDLSVATIRSHISGAQSKHDFEDPEKHLGSIGLFGVMEVKYGERPKDLVNFINMLHSNGLIDIK